MNHRFLINKFVINGVVLLAFGVFALLQQNNIKLLKIVVIAAIVNAVLAYFFLEKTQKSECLKLSAVFINPFFLV